MVEKRWDGIMKPGEHRGIDTEFKPGEHRNPEGEFKPGHVPAAPIRRGEHLSPQTEFKPGQQPANHLPVGSLVVRSARVNRADGDRVWIKVAEPNAWMLAAEWVWIGEFGPIPEGCVIHHLDGNQMNDILENLALVSRSGHMATHRVDITAAKMHTHRARPIECKQCHAIFPGKRAHALCPTCAQEARRAASRRHRERVCAQRGA